VVLSQPSDDRGGDIFATIILQEMTARLKLLVRLAGGSRYTLNEFVMEVAEDSVVRAPQGQKRLLPPIKYCPGG
jgi:hypothetical protein